MKRIVILGCGGHSRVLLDSFFRINDKDIRVECFLDNNEKLWGKKIDDIEIAGGDKLLKSLNTHAITAVLLHEISHAFLLYLVRAKGKNRKKMNIAADLIINETN
ncbi:MAG: hypothetical protein N2445_06775, partial [Acidobacteria bacterium]|nr:hypothetical protein [Acidobacteriota bacterium]